MVISDTRRNILNDVNRKPFTDIREDLFEELVENLRQENIYYKFRVAIPKNGKTLKFRGILIYKIMLASNKWKNKGIAVPVNLPQYQLNEIGGEKFKRWTGCELTLSNYWKVLNVLTEYSKKICRTKYSRKRRKPKTFKGHSATLSYDRKEKTSIQSPTQLTRAKEDINAGDLIILENDGVRKALQTDSPTAIRGTAIKDYNAGEVINAEIEIRGKVSGRGSLGGDLYSEETIHSFEDFSIACFEPEEKLKKIPNSKVKRIPKKRKI